jgi:sulfoxide reductase heme-binding subunit YedZ
MVPLAITSTNGMIKRLGAARWKRLHWLVYPAAVMAATHFWMSTKIVSTTAKAFALVLTVLLGYRLIAAMRNRVGLFTAPSATPTSAARR